MNNFRPIPTKCWENFLKSHGYKLSRIRGSHYQYTKRDARTIPVWGDEKEIPAFHIKSALRNMGMTLDEFYEWSVENC